MLNCISQLNGAHIIAPDGAQGHVKEVYFDDFNGSVRYLVIHVGAWISGRDVVISPCAVQHAKSATSAVNTPQPLPYEHENGYLRYYAYPVFLQKGAGLCALATAPLLTSPIPQSSPDDVDFGWAPPWREGSVMAEDSDLRSSTSVMCSEIHAVDGVIGQVSDLIFDDDFWVIRYAVVDTSKLWPGRKKVLLAMSWIDRIEGTPETVLTSLTREQVNHSPAYDDSAPLTRADEVKLYGAYNQPGYWVR